MKKEDYENIIKIGLDNGADFVEIFDEYSKSKSFILNDSKLDTINSANTKGIGIRVIKNNEVYYSSTNIVTLDNLKKIIVNLTKKLNQERSTNNFKLNNLEVKLKKVKKPHDSIRVSEKKKILLDIDKNVRKSSELIQQITLGFIEDDRNFIIANSEGKYIQSNTIVTRFIANIYVEKEGKKEHEFTDFAIGSGYDFLDEVNLEEKVLNCSKSAIKKLDAINIKGGEMPVIIAPGFGAVIFHEACGHGLEATSIAPHISVFSDDLGKKIASSKVTLIDDGTIENSWGGNIIDDEGEYTNKNTLIEKGILKQFLVDKANSNKMKQKSNGCGRRQDYTYPPTSRMSNTFLLPGTDKIDDMVKSINYGVYCEKMSGGSVNPATGEFNFAVETASLIENGKVTKKIKGITLIGTSKEILKNVEMISHDLELAGGYCGSKSGMIYVTIGQPTIKISKILVGGME